MYKVVDLESEDMESVAALEWVHLEDITILPMSVTVESIDHITEELCVLIMDSKLHYHRDSKLWDPITRLD